MSFIALSYLLSWLSPILLAIGIVFGCIFYNKLDNVHKLLFIYFIGCIAFDIAGRMMGHLFKQNNLILIPLFTLFELPVFALIYARVLSPAFKWLIYSCAITGVLYTVYECFKLDVYDLMMFQTYARTLGAFFIVAFSITFFFGNFFELDADTRNKMRVNTIILGFFSLNLIFLLPVNFLINAESPLRFYLLFGNMVLTIVFYSILTVSIWKNGKTPKP